MNKEEFLRDNGYNVDNMLTDSLVKLLERYDEYVRKDTLDKIEKLIQEYDHKTSTAASILDDFNKDFIRLKIKLYRQFIDNLINLKK